LGCSDSNVSAYTQDEELKFVQCDNCDIIWRSKDSSQITKPYEQDYFDSKKYDKRRKHKVKKSGWMLDLASLNHSSINSMLEIGCSMGYTLEAAKNREIDHLGIDVSEYAVKFCENIGLNASNAGLAELKEVGNKFDLVYMQHVLEHFKNPFEVLQDCNDLLNKNGLILIMVPNSEYGKAKKQKEKHRFYNQKGVGAEHFVYFNYTNIEKVLNASGFKVVQQNYPVFTGKYYDFDFFMNRLVRKALGCFNSDQELLVIAEKISAN